MRGSLGLLAASGVPNWFLKEEEIAAYEAAAQTRQLGPNDTIQIGLIGCGGQGRGVANWARNEGAKILAVCDVDRNRMNESREQFQADGYSDHRELLARSDLDAVIIGTPEHWHTIISIDAMRAGKDVYCEKPLTLTIAEGRLISNAAKNLKKVFQTGSQQRSDARFRLACELVRNGRVGQLKKVTTHLPSGPTGGPHMPEPVPAHLDWSRWLGPVPWADYTPKRCHWDFRWWQDYSGGMLTDWGAHHNDIAQWAMGMDDQGPIWVEGAGTPPPHVSRHHYDIFSAFDIQYGYPGGILMHCTNEGENGVEFEGTEGTIFVSRSRIGASDQKLIDDPLPTNAERLEASNNHMRNFLDCMRTRQKPICHAEVGHRSASVCHMANISLRLGGRRLEWDAETERFSNDYMANTLLSRPERDWE